MAIVVSSGTEILTRSISVQSVSIPSELCQAFCRHLNSFCLVLCALFLWITVFCSLLNMLYVLGNAVDLA